MYEEYTSILNLYTIKKIFKNIQNHETIANKIYIYICILLFFLIRQKVSNLEFSIKKRF